MRIPFQWNTANFTWESNPFPNQSITPFTWDDCALIVEIVTDLLGGKSSPSIFQDKKKKKKFIKLLCKIEGVEYKETKEVNIAIPALGPSFGVAPSGTCK